MTKRLFALRERDDEGAAMLIAIFSIMVVASVSILVLGVLTSQVLPTRYASKDARTITTAEAGLQAGLGALRNAVSADPNDGLRVQGDRNKLPCWTNQVGSLGAEGGPGAQYNATIQYFLDNPSGQDAAWRTSRQLGCVSGLGPSEFPRFALITAKGIGDAVSDDDPELGNRTMETVYTFNLTNVNIAGGMIRMGSSASAPCIDAGSNAPTAGTQVRTNACVDGLVSQQWSHRADFTVQLTSTNADPNGGMCLSANPGTNSSPTLVPVTLQVCNGADAKQRWGYDDGFAMYGRINLNMGQRWYLQPSGGFLRAGGSATSTLADPSTGAGAAGDTSDDVDGKPLQWVNYKEFGRCMDVTDWILDYSAYPKGRPSEILYPCKQDPMRELSPSARPGWNQVFTWSAATRLFWVNRTVDASGNTLYNVPSNPSMPRYCMQSPGVAGGYVNFDAACDQHQGKFRWTVNRNTGDAFTNYTVVDHKGLCMAQGVRNPAYGYVWSSVKVEVCTGGPEQKWNAPPNPNDAKVDNTREITGG